MLRRVMPKDQAMHYYRKLAKQLHPDKNQHALAKDAFQKLNLALEAVHRAKC